MRGWIAIRFFVLFLEVLTIAKLDHQLNEEIRDKEVRVIGADGAQLGIMSAAQANELAEEQEMDLVKISPNAVPPVCKIMDYSKFCFDQTLIISWSLFKLMSLESVMLSNHLILCPHPLLLLSAIFPSIRVFSNESALRMR